MYVSRFDGKTYIITDMQASYNTSDVYDFEIDTPEHVYQTSNKLIHHNTGKSLLTDIWLGENIKNGGISYKVDVEDATGEKFTSEIIGDKEVAAKIRMISPSTVKAVRKAKGDVGKLNPTDLTITIEKLTSILNKLIDFQLSKGVNKAKSIAVSIDSVSNLSSNKEVEDITDEKNKRDMTSQQNMRALFRVIGQKLKEANISIWGIAHLTANIGVMFGDKKTISAKGSGFKYASSIIMNMVSSKEIKDKKTEVSIGIRMKVKITKNRMAFKGRETFLTMYFKKGIDPYSGMGELLHQFGLVKASGKKGNAATQEKDGHFDESTVFTYKCRMTGLSNPTITWTTKELGNVLENTGAKEEILHEWNERLNEEYARALGAAGVTEEDFLEEEDLESEEEDIDIEE
jgi:RecA/RadA recombinase